MKSISLNTFERNMEELEADFPLTVQFNAFKKCYFQLLVTREDIKTSLQAVASIQRLISSNDEQCELLVDSLANAFYFTYQKKQALEEMKKRFSYALENRMNKSEKLKQKLLDSVVKVQKVVELKKKKLDKIQNNHNEIKLAINQMKAIVDDFESGNQKDEKEAEISSLNTDLTLTNNNDQPSAATNLMEKYISARNTLEENKSSFLQNQSIVQTLMAELDAVETQLHDVRTRKMETVKIVPNRNQSDFTLNQSVWDF
uniref:Uncharacterized protein n=1 Tax=Panagrolaimus sp. PS1159 TaxID=55785 RepID=A0AC35F0F5_9BILA